MIRFRLTPLWKMKETEQWLNNFAENGQILRAVYGPFYYFSSCKNEDEKKNPPAFWFSFVEKGIEDHGVFLWNSKYHGLSVPCHMSYYLLHKYKNSKTRARALEEEWYIRRDLYAVGAAEMHLGGALLCGIVFQYLLYDKGFLIGVWLVIIIAFACLVHNICALVILKHRLKHLGIK